MNTLTPPKTRRGQARREQILQAAEDVIGAKGFSSASIADITRAADTALGTFYIYFSTKEDVFRELVQDMGHVTRTMIGQAVASSPDRLSAERAGLEAFLRFVIARPSLYRIVEEARFVDPDAYRAYFSGFAEAYATQLSAAQSEGAISAGDPEIRAWALMGIAKSLGDRFVIWEKDDIDIERVVDEAFRMICDGLAP